MRPVRGNLSPPMLSPPLSASPPQPPPPEPRKRRAKDWMEPRTAVLAARGVTAKQIRVLPPYQRMRGLNCRPFRASMGVGAAMCHVRQNSVCHLVPFPWVHIRIGSKLLWFANTKRCTASNALPLPPPLSLCPIASKQTRKCCCCEHAQCTSKSRDVQGDITCWS